MADFFNILSNFGFPVAVSVYLLVRFESKIDKMQDKIDNLSQVIKDLTTIISNKK